MFLSEIVSRRVIVGAIGAAGPLPAADGLADAAGSDDDNYLLVHHAFSHFAASSFKVGCVARGACPDRVTWRGVGGGS